MTDEPRIDINRHLGGLGGNTPNLTLVVNVYVHMFYIEW
jgi:hypothetical protein